MEIKNIDRIAGAANGDSVKISPNIVNGEQSVNPFQSADNSTFSKNSPVSTAPFAQKNITPFDAYQIAHDSILNYFKNTFMETAKFKEVFGNATWDDIGDIVIGRLALERAKDEEMKHLMVKLMSSKLI